MATTATLNATEVPSQAEVASPSVLRKRRRRVPATGAAEDCHACRKRQQKCDRRRPYCSQCLEVGNECSGYRTTLTWGVGVASRGKLRGMTLPIVKSPTSAPMNANTPASESKPRKRAHSDSAQGGSHSSNQGGDTRLHKHVRLTPINTAHWKDRKPSNPDATIIQCQTPSSIGSPTADNVCGLPMNWQQAHNRPVYPSHRHSFHGAHGQTYPPALPQHSQRPDLFPLHTSICSTFDHSLLPEAMVPGSPADSNVNAQDPCVNLPPTPEDLTTVDPSLNFFVNAPQISMPRSVPSTTFQVTKPLEEFSFDIPPNFKTEQGQDASHIPRSSFSKSAALLGAPLFDVSQPLQALTSAGTYDQSLAPEETSLCSDTNQNGQSGSKALTSIVPASTFPSTFPTNQFNLSFNTISPRIQYLLDYYDKAICPVLVAFDGPNNPYRAHILHRAAQNPSLQHALAALVTNNLRMRCLKDVPEFRNYPEKSRDFIQACIGAPSSEEQHHKAKSIEYLNAQLADPNKAQDDSVLATLLILCLFHVCDSGFSKFKTQLAGVQKLLKLRSRSGNPSQGSESDFVGWVEAFFAWFDVMTAAVNDRETQIEGTALDLGNVNDNLGALEQFSGCDGRLFKLISRLGRLNLLSQGREVRRNSQELAQASLPPTPVSVTQRENSLLGKTKDFYSLHFDSPTLDPIDKPQDIPPTTQKVQDVPVAQTAGNAFYQEWQFIREKLQEWSPDPNIMLSNNNSHLNHISESFRYAALLYTERLASPTLPSSSPTIQTYVQKALSHIEDIGPNSCVTKFMLWPLFIAGTECVEEVHRNLIRARCVEIQKESGFYNNVSGLEVLERVWRENDREVFSPRPCGAQAFKWRGCMDRVDGEYIVI